MCRRRLYDVVPLRHDELPRLVRERAERHGELWFLRNGLRRPCERNSHLQRWAVRLHLLGGVHEMRRPVREHADVRCELRRMRECVSFPGERSARLSERRMHHFLRLGLLDVRWRMRQSHEQQFSLRIMRQYMWSERGVLQQRLRRFLPGGHHELRRPVCRHAGQRRSLRKLHHGLPSTDFRLRDRIALLHERRVRRKLRERDAERVHDGGRSGLRGLRRGPAALLGLRHGLRHRPTLQRQLV